MNEPLSQPVPQPEWEQAYEIWYGDEPYKIATLHVSAATLEEAREAAKQVLTELLPRAFPGATFVITTPITLRHSKTK